MKQVAVLTCMSVISTHTDQYLFLTKISVLSARTNITGGFFFSPAFCPTKCKAKEAVNFSSGVRNLVHL